MQNREATDRATESGAQLFAVRSEKNLCAKAGRRVMDTMPSNDQAERRG